jgi:hypothetical protein
MDIKQTIGVLLFFSCILLQGVSHGKVEFSESIELSETIKPICIDNYPDRDEYDDVIYYCPSISNMTEAQIMNQIIMINQEQHYSNNTSKIYFVNDRNIIDKSDLTPLNAVATYNAFGFAITFNPLNTEKSATNILLENESIPEEGTIDPDCFVQLQSDSAADMFFYFCPSILGMSIQQQYALVQELQRIIRNSYQDGEIWFGFVNTKDFKYVDDEPQDSLIATFYSHDQLLRIFPNDIELEKALYLGEEPIIWSCDESSIIVLAGNVIQVNCLAFDDLDNDKKKEELERILSLPQFEFGQYTIQIVNGVQKEVVASFFSEDSRVVMYPNDMLKMELLRIGLIDNRPPLTIPVAVAKKLSSYNCSQVYDFYRNGIELLDPPFIVQPDTRFLGVASYFDESFIAWCKQSYDTYLIVQTEDENSPFFSCPRKIPVTERIGGLSLAEDYKKLGSIQWIESEKSTSHPSVNNGAHLVLSTSASNLELSEPEPSKHESSASVAAELEAFETESHTERGLDIKQTHPAIISYDAGVSIGFVCDQNSSQWKFFRIDL